MKPAPANTNAKHPSRRGELKRALMEHCADANVGAPARLVYCVLWSFANENGLAWPGTGTLEDGTGLSPSGLRKATRELEAAGLVRTTRAAKNGPRITIGAATLNRSSVLCLLWPIATATGKETFARWVAPHAVVPDPMARTWRVRLEGGALANEDLTTAALREHLRTGRVPPTAPVWTEGMRWTPAVDVPALAPACSWPIAS